MQKANKNRSICGRESLFKRVAALALAAFMLSALTACGGQSGSDTDAQPQSAAAAAPADSAPAAPAESSAPDTSAPAAPSAPSAVSPASDGVLTIGYDNIAITVNGTAVPMPYRLTELEAAGVPADESRSEIELGAGDFFSVNLYLDENEDYLLIPAYYNAGDSSISITEAEAEEIVMTTYADEPADQGVSILGVSFGMPGSEVKSLLGEPMWDEGDYLEWEVEVPGTGYRGSFSIYLVSDADDAGVSQADLSVFEG